MNNKKNKKIILAISLIFLVLIFIVLPLAFAQTSVTACCEKTLNGAYCQNSPVEQCNTKYLSSPTSCDSTSYCQLGVCYDSDEGLCMERVPKKACEEANGLWTSDENPPQCNLGCCIVGEQAAFTTLQRCKKLAGQYGLQADFRPGVNNEIACIGIANAQDLGACVFESEFTRTCKFGTRSECDTTHLPKITNNSEVKFFKDFLCTAEELNTNCQKTEKTTCIEGKDEVYFIDTCGNRANIYDASKINDVNYWKKIIPKSASCSSNSKNCGNCDYLSGSICARASQGQKPSQGDFICRDINCYDTSNKKDYKNGESWCFYDNGKSNDDRVGARHFRHICFMGEEIVEPCLDLRGEVCIEDSIEGDGKETFSQAGCVVNRWVDCLLQSRKVDCLNSDARDCKWIPVGENSENIVAGAADQVTQGIAGLFLNVYDSRRDQGACVPNISPGYEFWDPSSAAQCDLVSSSCIVTYEKGLVGGKKCVDNCFCDIKENPQAALQALNICSSIGDCGPKANYKGKFINRGYEFTIEDEQIGPNLDLGIFSPDKAEKTSQPADPVTNPQFTQGVQTRETFQTSTQTQTQEVFSQGGQVPQPPVSGNIVKEIITETYKRLS